MRFLKIVRQVDYTKYTLLAIKLLKLQRGITPNITDPTTHILIYNEHLFIMIKLSLVGREYKNLTEVKDNPFFKIFFL